MKLKLSVPQCVQMTEDAAAFDQALTDSQLTGQKAAVVTEMKATVEALLAKTNARVFWQVGALNEALPAHVPAANVNIVTLRNKDAGGAVGRTTGPAAGDPFNETIDAVPRDVPRPGRHRRRHRDHRSDPGAGELARRQPGPARDRRQGLRHG